MRRLWRGGLWLVLYEDKDVIHGLVVVIKVVVLGGGRRVMGKRGVERVDLSHWRCEHRYDVGLRSE